MNRTILFLLFFALLGQTYLLAQQPATPRPVGDAAGRHSAFRPPPRIRFEHLTVADGLPQNLVTCMIQDHLGFIWMGTQGGIARYDGTQMVDFQDKASILKGKFFEALHEARNGDIWIGGERLARFERATSRFIEYPQKTPGSNRAIDFIGFIHEDRRGDIWTITKNYSDGLSFLNRFNPKTGIWTYFRHDPANPHSLATNSVYLSLTNGMANFAFLEDRAGTIWVTTRGDENTLHRFDAKTNRFNRFTPTASPAVVADFKRISVMAEDGQGGLYVSSYNRGKGLFRVEPQTGGRGSPPGPQVTQFKHDPRDPNSIRDDSVSLVHLSRDGTVWVPTSRGLDRLDPKTGRFTHVNANAPNNPSPGLLKFLAETPNGDLWFAATDGLNRYNPRRQTFERYQKRNEPDGLKVGTDNDITSFLVDRTGVVWAGKDDDGVYKQSRTVKFSSIMTTPDLTKQGLPGTESSANVIRLYEAPSEPGVIWMGTYMGLERLDRKTGRRTVYRHDDRNSQSIGEGYVFDMAEDKQGRFWVGTQGGGLNLLDRKHGTFTRFMHDPANANSLMNDNIRSVFPASDSTLWIGTFEGLDHYDPTRRTFTHYSYQAHSSKRHATGLNSTYVLSLKEDAQKRIWLGTALPGSVQVLDPRTGQFTTILPPGNALSSVQCLLADTRPDCFWVGDAINGLLLVNGKGRILKHFTRANGLPSNSVISVHRDKQGLLWVGTGNGMVRLDRNAGGAAFRPPQTDQIRAFSQRNGLKGLFTPTWCASNGEVYAGSDNDVVAFFPEQAQDDPIPPPVVLTDLAINGQPATIGEVGQLPAHISVAKEITLPHDQNDLTFHFAALSYNRGNESKYAYQLIPIDKNWVQNGTIRQARYSDLSPGEYTFRVKAANADGVWNEKGTSIQLTIRPPWRRTWWAYLLYALVFGAALRAYIVYRSRALLRENRVLEEKVAQRTQEVQEQKEEILVQRDNLEQTLSELQSTQAQLIQKEKLASLGELTAGIAHEIQNPLNFVNNFSEVSAELVDELKEELTKGEVEEAAFIADDLRQNLQKIHHHGGRASAIVRGMLEHGRIDSGEKRPTDLNSLAGEYLKIAYHGLRAKDKNFNCELVTDFAPDLGRVAVVQQEIGRVLLNLYNNAFYAVQQRQLLANEDYQPTVRVGTKRLANAVEVRISDNGTGIPDAVKSKIFQPFFTTKPTGEGTGLGLSLSYDIVTKGHGGTLEVESIAGDGTVFTIRLPFAGNAS